MHDGIDIIRLSTLSRKREREDASRCRCNRSTLADLRYAETGVVSFDAGGAWIPRRVRTMRWASGQAPPRVSARFSHALKVPKMYQSRKAGNG